MCGIFGSVGEISETKTLECINQIKHRGPDAIEIKKMEGASLAHARLAIIDVSTNANQPMQSMDGRYWIVFNGEIYNYLEIKRELKQLGHQFKTSSDTEVLLYAYLQWGEEFQNKCNGMWALAIWDCQKKELFISRDRFGIKPLYYYQDNDNFYFASEMKTFFPIMKSKRINYVIFDKKDYFGYEATENCVLSDIHRVPAGTCGMYKNNLKLKKWWETADHLIDVPRSYSEQVEYFRELFIDSCKLRMRSDVPIGTALSGGVDSCSVLGTMNYISKSGMKGMNTDWQHAFVANMENTQFDETKDARRAANYVGLDVVPVEIKPSIDEKILLNELYMCEDPYITSPTVYLKTYAGIRNKGIKVTIDGMGADELFGGYSFDTLSAVFDCNGNERKIERLCQLYNGLTGVENHFNKNAMMKMINYPREEIENLKSTNMDYFNKKLYEETHKVVLPTILRLTDRYSMTNGLEIRMPFMDYRIVCFAFSIPWTSKLRNGYTKAIVRDMAKPFMTNEILLKKRKIGFNSPLSEWFNGDLKEFLLDTIHSKDFFECDLINPLEIITEVNEFYANKKDDFVKAEKIWTLLIPFLWKKAFIDC